MKKIYCLLLILAPVISIAQQVEYGNNLIITKPVHGNLYVSGNNIVINAPVYGDLIVAGATVTVNDTVQNDILVTGGEIHMDGYVGEDIRCVAGKLFINKNTGGDLAVTASTLNVSKEAVIAGNLLAYGGDIILEGTIKGFVKTGVSTLVMNGTIEKGLESRGNEINVNGTVNGVTVLAAKYIEIGRNAVFMQNVRYWNENGSTDFGQSLKNGKAIYDKTLAMEYPSWQFLGYSSFVAFIWYLCTVFIFILLIRLLFSKIIVKAGEVLFNDTWRSVGYGLLFIFVVPIIIVIVFITLIGVPLSLLMLIGYITLLLLGNIIFSLLLAQWANSRYKKKWGFWKSGWVALGLFILLKLASLIPIAGWLISLTSMCIAYGSILLILRSSRNNNKIKHAIPVS